MCIRIIIPCFNEEGCIQNILNELHTRVPTPNILVIDDGSTDHTASKATECRDITLIRLPVNLGVGGAVQTGFMYARDHDDDIAVKFDGDGQHDPNSISTLLQPLVNDQADIVIGSRFLREYPGYKSTLLRRIGIKVLQFIAWFLTGQKITDPTSGLRAYNSKAIKFMADHYPSFDYPEPEEIILASKNGLRITEVPVLMRERQSGVSTISSAISVYYMLKVTLAMLFISLRDPENK